MKNTTALLAGLALALMLVLSASAASVEWPTIGTAARDTAEQQIAFINNTFVLENGEIRNGTITTEKLAFVPFSGDYNDLNNTPSLPENVSQLLNDAGYNSSLVALGQLENDVGYIGMDPVGTFQVNGTIITYKEGATSFRLAGVDSNGDYVQSYAGVFSNDAYDNTGGALATDTRVIYGSNRDMDLEMQGSRDIRLTAVDDGQTGGIIRAAASANMQFHPRTSAETDAAKHLILDAVGGSSGADVELSTNAGDLVLDPAGEVQIKDAGTAGKVMCWKTASTLGSCTDQPDASGACSCA